jgi:predicted transcriptional regulator
MNIQAEKLNLIEWISKLNDTSIIEKLREIKSNYTHSPDWTEKLHKEEIESIERGLKDLDEGRVHSHEIARDIYAR